MKILITSTILFAGIAVAAPAFAQGIYVGPGGVGVDTGAGYGYSHRGYDRDRDRDYGRRGDYYEGRSVARGHRDGDYDSRY